MNNQQVEQLEKAIKVAGANVAPRVTMADIEANVEAEVYFRGDEAAQIPGNVPAMTDFREKFAQLGCLTFCVLILKNGFTVTGESACASPENFNAEIGRKIARQNAIDKVWPLLGYELRTKLSQP